MDHGKEKVRVQMNVMPRSTMNTVRPRNLVGRAMVARSNPEVVGHQGQKNFFFTMHLMWFPDSLNRSNAQWVFHGFHVEL